MFLGACTKPPNFALVLEVNNNNYSIVVKGLYGQFYRI